MKHARAVLVAALALAAMPVTAAEARFGDETLRKGDSGRDVKTLQRTLNDAGYETDVDGEFGPHTQKRVRAFEGNEERRVDGKVTPSDARALKAAAERGAEDTSDEEPGTTKETPGDEATVDEDGFAIAPANAPRAVKDVIAAGNEIAKKPYKYGGGHGKLRDSGYDCSGSVSYALRRTGLMEESMPSGAMTRWGERGRGDWITVYANSGHAYMVIAGIRFDTSARKRSATRWTAKGRSSRGYRARHPEGL